MCCENASKSLPWKTDSTHFSLQESVRQNVQHCFQILLHVWGNPKWLSTSWAVYHISEREMSQGKRHELLNLRRASAPLCCQISPFTGLEILFYVIQELVKFLVRGCGPLWCWNPVRDGFCLAELVSIANSTDKGKVSNKSWDICHTWTADQEQSYELIPDGFQCWVRLVWYF